MEATPARTSAVSTTQGQTAITLTLSFLHTELLLSRLRVKPTTACLVAV